MDVIEYTPTREQYAYTFGGVAPAMRIKPGTALRLWSDDAFGGALRSVDDLSSAKVDLRFVNPQTGPFYVEGAEPGDTLVLHLVALEPARDWGASAAIPFFGGMTSTDRVVTLQEPLPDTTWIYELDRDRGTVGFAARHSDHRIELPVEPMLGTVGVAPAGGEVRSSLVPDRFGGNMDTPQMRAGSTVFLGVNVEGAMFSIGDGHYRQGEGEACGTAVEGAMTTTLIVELIKGGAPGWPRIEDDTHWMTVGSSRPMEDSWRIANAELVHWVGELYGLHTMDAYQLCSQIARGAGRQRRRRQLQRRRQGGEGAPPRGGRLRRDPRRPARASPLTRHDLSRATQRPHSDLTQRKASTMDLQLTGKRVLVTGGTRGIGRAIVEAFLDEGAVVGFCARRLRRGGGDERRPAQPRQRHRLGRRRGRRRRPRGLGRAVGRGLRRPRRRRRQRQRSRDPRHRGELAGQPQRRPHAHRPPRPSRAATPRAQRRRLDHRDLERLRTRVRLRLGPVRHREDRDRRLHPRPGNAAGRQEHSRQHRLARNTYFEGGVWQSIETGNPALFETAVGLNPTGQHGHSGGGRRTGGLPRQPAASRVSGTNLVVDGALTRGVQL